MRRHPATLFTTAAAVCALALAACGSEAPAGSGSASTTATATTTTLLTAAATTSATISTGTRPDAATTTSTLVVGDSLDGGDLVPSSTDPSGAPVTTLPDHPPAFADGHWELTYSVDYALNGSAESTGVSGLTVLRGDGTLDVEHGTVAGGTMDAAGPSAGAVSSPATAATSDGTLTITGTLDGDATAPLLHASSGFSGTVTANGKTIDVNTTFGVFTGTGVRLVIASASDAMVTGDWTVDLGATDKALGLSSVNIGSFTAVRTDRCAGTGATVPLWPDRIKPGTPDAPNHVHLDVDPSIAADRGLQAQLSSAVQQWNSALASAGVGIVLDVASSADGSDAPVVHIGLDTPAAASTRDQDGTVLGPVLQKWAAVTQWLRWTKDGTHLDTSEAVIRLNGHIEDTRLSGFTWPELAQQYAWFLRQTFVHELGHVLGLGDQHTDPHSVMYFQGSALSDGPFSARSFDCADVRALAGLLG